MASLVETLQKEENLVVYILWLDTNELSSKVTIARKVTLQNAFHDKHTLNQ